jgi:alpha-1,2-mannosyltransferase
VMVSAAVRAGVMALGLGGLALAWRAARVEMLRGVALALAVICLIAPLGWGHTYVYALPLQLLLARRWPVVVGMCWATMLVSANHRFGFIEGVPVLWDAVYGRYALAVLLLGYVAVRAVPDQHHGIGGKGRHQRPKTAF